MRQLAAAMLLLTSTALADGKDQYIPTKLEWLISEASTQTNAVTTSSISAILTAQPPNTVLVAIFHEKNETFANIKALENLVRGRIDQVKKRHGWTWAQVKFEHRAIKSPSEDQPD